MEAGGSVLWLIALLVLLMWGLIFERIYYLSHGHNVFLDTLVSSGIQGQTKHHGMPYKSEKNF